MDRNIVYPGAVPLDTDILALQRSIMVAIGSLAQTVMGSGTVVDGLACTAGAGLTVQIGPGSIFTLAALDGTAFGSLPADTTDSIVKGGYNTSVITSTTLAAPGTVGQAINYLVEVQFQETDATPVVLSYYNASNPAVPYTGPANAGTAQNTQRIQRVGIQFKAGTAATVGTQVTPGADSGWTGIYIVTVNNGAVSLNSSNIVVYPGAPFIPTKLPMQRRKLTGPLNLYVAPTGNDSNSGLSAANPFATCGAAVAYIYNNLDVNGQAIVVNLTAGTFTTGTALVGLPVGYSGGSISFIGVGASTVVSVTNGTPFVGLLGANFSVSSMTLTGTGTGNSQGYGVYAQTGANITVGTSIAFASCAVASIGANGGTVSGSSAFSVTGSSQALWKATNAGSTIAFQGISIVLSSAVFSVGTAVATLGGQVQVPSNSFAGSATGPRFDVESGGIVYTAGAAAGTYLPGSTAGVGTNFGAAPYGLYA